MIVQLSEQKPKKEATSIKIDPDLWKEAKIEAIRRDIELGELVEVALKKELKGAVVRNR